MAFFQSFGAPAFFVLSWLVVYTTLGLLGGLAGVALRNGRSRKAALAGS